MTIGWLLFTDLNGTLLDDGGSSIDPSLPSLKTLRRLGIPLIPVTSKTLAETARLRHTLQLRGPLVAENGAVLAYPGETTQVAPPGYHRLRDFLVDRRANPDFNTLGFGDMGLEEIMAATGLPREEAKLARRRLGSEPLIWRGSEKALTAFREEVTAARLRLIQGRRCLHLLGDTDKGTAVRHVIKHLRNRARLVTRTIAMGDADNDRDMLLAADIPVIIRRPDGSHLSLPERPDALISEQPGTAGWNQVVLELLRKYTRQDAAAPHLPPRAGEEN